MFDRDEMVVMIDVNRFYRPEYSYHENKNKDEIDNDVRKTSRKKARTERLMKRRI